MDEVSIVLKREFDAEEGSFLLSLRSDLVWTGPAFTRLEQAMRTACRQCEGQAELPRWMAEGFYLVSHYVAEWTDHPNFPRPEPLEYYHGMHERLRILRIGTFAVGPAYQEPHVWRDL